ncbi:hypothetical protein ACHAXT_010218 [Thalassiosira profunda]
MDSDASASDASSSSSSSSSASSASSPPVAIEDYDDEDFPFDFASGGDDPSGGGGESDDDDGFGSTVDSLSFLKPESTHADDVNEEGAVGNFDSGTQLAPSSIEEASTSSNIPPSPSTTVPHRGSLRRILSPSSFHAQQAPASPGKSHAAASTWPMYAINVASGDLDGPQQQYQVLFDRQQYETCTRLFALLDTESQSAIGPECVREFVCLHCPVVRKRDEAIFALRGGEGGNQSESCSSPTFDEIWEGTVQSDPRFAAADAPSPTVSRIGIEGWMVFSRLLALAYHQESQRRFASRHLQQMMRHKHGGASRMNPHEVVVVVDNPPPGPPSPITIRALVEVERERVSSHSELYIEGWPFCPLPLPALDLDHCLLNTRGQILSAIRQGAVLVEPFSSSREGDFIIRFQGNDFKTVVRRSYADFEWLNAILKLHKRPGQGHLCGRILPPFPSRDGSFSLLTREMTRKSAAGRQDEGISERAIAVAKSGMGMISSVAKSVWSGVSGSSPTSSPSKARAAPSSTQPGPRDREEEDVTKIVAQRIERYLNYLLENDALSDSFPLNAILRASQSGLESAKQTLQDHAKQKKRQRSRLAAATSKGGLSSAPSIFSALVTKPPSSLMRAQGDDDTPWLRAAAQVAMSLQFHGMLESTGHQSTSAKIQHASLPKFGSRPVGSWDDEEADNKRVADSNDSPKSETNFEAGVVKVESSLIADEEGLGGYDMLPSPGPSDEHRVLNAGNAAARAGTANSTAARAIFVYDTAVDQPEGAPDRKDAVLGTIRVENDIDKLRDIIRSINRTLGKMCQCSVLVQSAQDDRNAIQLGLLRDIDTWGDSRGEVISQRALVKGVAELQAFNASVEECNKAVTDDLLWQSSLATSAVAAVTEVRDAVKASRTASRAKSAAFAAAEKAKKAYESCDHSSSKEKVQRTRSEASSAQSHAIHATVVEYEANIAKKRAAVSLAQDVRSWNVHRKRELLRTCAQFAKSQQEACRKAVDAWESLRDGIIDSSGYSVVSEDVLKAADAPTGLRVSPEYGDAMPSYTGSESWGHSSSLHDWEVEQGSSAEMTKGLNASSSVADGFTDVGSMKESQQSGSEMEGSSGNVYRLAPPNISHLDLDEDYFSLHAKAEAASDGEGEENEDVHSSNHYDAESDEESTQDAVSTTSMQSLIDGLMAWGGEDEQRNADEAFQTGGAVGGEQNLLLE